jgi:hypothetical protein
MTTFVQRAIDQVRHAEAYARDPREYITHVLAAYDADPSLSEADSHRYHSYPFVRIFAFSRISTETLKRIEKGANENMWGKRARQHVSLVISCMY